MLKNMPKKENSEETKLDAHRDFVGKLTIEDLILLKLRQELYDGSWSALEKDLQDRLQNRPLIYKIIQRIRTDLERLEKLRAYEQQNNVDLLNLLPRADGMLEFMDFMGMDS